MPFYQIKNAFVNLYLIESGDEFVLIDTGIAKSGPRVVLRKLEAIGKQPNAIKHILITHADPDHTGGLAELQRLTGAQSHSHKIEADAIARGTYARASKAKGTQRFVTDVVGKLLMPTPKAARIDRVFEEATLLPFVGGIRAIPTPGHTPGHMSYYFEREGVLFAGDSLNASTGKLRCSDGPFMWNYQAACESVRKQAQLQPRVVCCGHGVVLRETEIVFPA